MKTRGSVAAFVALAFALVSSRALAQQPLDGHWEGAISIMGTDLGFGVDFATSKEGLAATIDIPQQGAAGLKLTGVRHEAPKVHFELPAGPGLAVFDGELKDGEISGSFLQAGIAGTFHLKRGQSAKTAPPPEPTVPYAQEEVRFKNGDVTIAGTLTLPPSGGPHPAVVMITGSGAQNRDEEILGFKPFRLIADHLTRGGIAVLRTDDRGVGGSTGASDRVTTEDFVGDVLAAIAFLKSRSEIDPKRIGLCGHSEGGIVAPMAASRAKDIAFVVLMSGSAVTGEKILLAQAELIARAGGASEAFVRKEAEMQQGIFKAARTGQGWDELTVEIRKEVLAKIERMPPAQRKGIPDPARFADSYVEGQLKAAKSPWLKFFLDYDPATALEKVQCPVLALFGEKDLQVPAEMNKVALVRALEKGGNKDHTVEVVAGANHLYQTAVTGSPVEHASLKKEFAPAFLDLIAKWIRERTGLAGTGKGAGAPATPAGAPATAEGAPSAQQVAPAAGADDAASHEKRAEAFLRLLDKEQFDTATKEFDAAMTAAMPVDKLRETWKGLLSQVGSLKSVDERRKKTQASYSIVDLICTFERAPLVVRVALDSDGKVAGLFFLPADKAIPASPS